MEFGGINNIVEQGLHIYIGRDNGRIGLEVSVPGFQLELSTNSAVKPTSNTWTVPSNIRQKDVKGKYEKGLSEILKLEPIVYCYKKNNEMDIKETEKKMPLGLVLRMFKKYFQNLLALMTKVILILISVPYLLLKSMPLKS